MVLTPHDGEYRRLMDAEPGPDRISAARKLAVASGAVALLKGPTTAVASPDGRVLLGLTGTTNLATAGTGDVLSGVIGAMLSRGVAPLEAAALAAHVHGRAGARAGEGLGGRRPPRPGRPGAGATALCGSVPPGQESSPRRGRPPWLSAGDRRGPTSTSTCCATTCWCSPVGSPGSPVRCGQGGRVRAGALPAARAALDGGAAGWRWPWSRRA